MQIQELDRVSDGDRAPSGAQNVDNFERSNPEWQRATTRGRWAEYYDPSSRTYKPPRSEARTKARRQKYAWTALTMREGPEFVPLHLCMTGDELVAELPRIAGDGTSFRFPRTDEARGLVELLPHGRLRPVEALLLAMLAYAMLVRKRHGLVATMLELGACVGLFKTATSEAMSRLIALGWVRRDATYTRYGKCESQRGNLWRLTRQALEAFALFETPSGVRFPDGTVDRDRLMQRRVYAGAVVAPTPAPAPSPGIATPRNPVANPESVQTSGSISGSFRNGDRPAHPDYSGANSEHPTLPNAPTEPTSAAGDVTPSSSPQAPATRRGMNPSAPSLVAPEAGTGWGSHRASVHHVARATSNAVPLGIGELDHDALLRDPEAYARALADKQAAAKSATDEQARAARAARIAELDAKHDDAAKRFALLELDAPTKGGAE